jgi:hypothetical protein
MSSYLDMITNYSGFCILFKILSHMVIELIRKDKGKTIYSRGGAGVGGMFLFPIPKGENNFLSYWAYLANILFYGSIIIVVVNSNL